jgi:hypothetical protein
MTGLVGWRRPRASNPSGKPLPGLLFSSILKPVCIYEDDKRRLPEYRCPAEKGIQKQYKKIIDPKNGS